MKKWRNAAALLLAVILLLSTAATAADSGEDEAVPFRFRDVKDGAWYEEAVTYVYQKGLMVGTDADTFSPDLELSRGQLVTMLWRVAGEPTVNAVLPFGDVGDGEWYTEAVRWAAAEKITDRQDGTFGVQDALRRDEAVYLLWNLAKYLEKDVSVGEDTNILSYYDVFEVREGYMSAMQWAVGDGIIEGDGMGFLNPGFWLTRAQTAVILQRFTWNGRPQSPLSLWTRNSMSAEALIAYVNAVTDETGDAYIPVRDRIAVFDFDGTLFCETDPNYFDYTLLAYRVLDDPDYRDKASDFEREVAGKIREQNETGKSFSGLEIDHGKAVASAFSGMTLAEFNAYIQEFKKQPMPSYAGMNRGGGFYLPMVQVVEYLQANDFTVYIVSGTDRLIVRGILDGSVLDIPNRQIIGSDETIVASGQGDTDGLNYFFSEDDELILGGDFLIKNLKMNKVSVIMQEIGQQPVLSFGNSTGDGSMAEYVTSGNPYPSLAFMLCCDDTVRENGSQSKADKMYDLCEEYGWVPVSMQNDWVTIYGDSVTYLGAAEAEEVQPAA